jgi:hypothetical protein
MAFEDFEEIERTTKLVTAISAILIVLVNVWMILSLASDLFKFNLQKMIEQISEYGWRLPPEWVEEHRAEMDMLMMILLLILLIDTLAYTLYSSRKQELPVTYRVIVSAVEAPIALVLYLAGFPYGIFFFFAVGALAVTVIRKQREPIFTTAEQQTVLPPESLALQGGGRSAIRRI